MWWFLFVCVFGGFFWFCFFFESFEAFVFFEAFQPLHSVWHCVQSIAICSLAFPLLQAIPGTLHVSLRDSSHTVALCIYLTKFWASLTGSWNPGSGHSVSLQPKGKVCKSLLSMNLNPLNLNYFNEENLDVALLCAEAMCFFSQVCIGCLMLLVNFHSNSCWLKEQELCFWQFLAGRVVVAVWEVSSDWFKTEAWMDPVCHHLSYFLYNYWKWCFINWWWLPFNFLWMLLVSACRKSFYHLPGQIWFPLQQ